MPNRVCPVRFERRPSGAIRFSRIRRVLQTPWRHSSSSGFLKPGQRPNRNVMYIGDHGRIIQIILLHSMFRTESKKRSGRAIACETARVFDCRDRLVSDMFCPDIPDPSFPALSQLPTIGRRQGPLTRLNTGQFSRSSTKPSTWALQALDQTVSTLEWPEEYLSQEALIYSRLLGHRWLLASPTCPIFASTKMHAMRVKG